jgi:predicted KAP-like P-loop ATPase
MVSDSDMLIKSLFEEIFFSIDNGYSKVKNKLVEYAKKIIPPSTRLMSYMGTIQQGVDPRTSQIVSQAASETAKEISELLFNTPLSKTKEKLREELEIMFVDNQQKIVIMIDELDRLFPDEVITIFQLIKSTLDLPGLFFVVAMDNNVIHDSLNKVGIREPERYLQKIFQRNYLIHSDFQMRTLTKGYLYEEINHFDEQVKETLTYMFDTFIFLEKKNQIQVPYAPSPYTDKNNKLQEHIHNYMVLLEQSLKTQDSLLN